MNFSRIPATLLIILSIAIVFVVQLRIDGARDISVAMLGGIRPDTLTSGHWWQLVTAMFLHFGWLHVASNLWALYQLGGVFEMLFGSRRFLLTYFGSGLFASLASALTISDNTLSAGASGAVFGIMGALLIAVRRSARYRGQPWTRGLTQQLVFWALLNIAIGFSVQGIDNAAHLGGFVAGLIFGIPAHRVAPLPPREVVIDAEVQSSDDDTH